MRTIGDILTDAVVKTVVSTTTSYYTDAQFRTWIRDAHNWAAGYKKWPHTEGRINSTYTTTEEWNFEGLKADSVRILMIGGKRYDKVTFQDYQIYKEDEPSGSDRIFTDYGRTLFINTVSGGSGTLTAYAQYMPQIDVTDLTAVTVFSDGDDDANEAISEEMQNYYYTKEKRPKDALYHHQRAMQILDTVWSKVQGEQFNYKTKDRGMFERINVLRGGLTDDLIHRDQFPFG